MSFITEQSEIKQILKIHFVRKSHLKTFPPQVALTISNLNSRQHLPVSGCAGRCVVCDLLARSQQPPDISLFHPLPDEEPQLRGPARGAGRAAALTHALRSLWPGHRGPERKTHRSRLALNMDY